MSEKICKACGAEHEVEGTCVHPVALPTPPADDVREALIGILSYNSGDEVEAVRRILNRFEVRPRGTVTDAAVDAAHGAFEEYPDYDPNTSLLDPWLHEREAIRAALEAAWEAQQ